MVKSITWSEFNWACISFAEDKMPQVWAETADSYNKDLAVQHHGKTQHLVMSVSSRQDLQPNIKNDYLIYD